MGQRLYTHSPDTSRWRMNPELDGLWTAVNPTASAMWYGSRNFRHRNGASEAATNNYPYINLPEAQTAPTAVSLIGIPSSWQGETLRFTAFFTSTTTGANDFTVTLAVLHTEDGSQLSAASDTTLSETLGEPAATQDALEHTFGTDITVGDSDTIMRVIVGRTSSDSSTGDLRFLGVRIERVS